MWVYCVCDDLLVYLRICTFVSESVHPWVRFWVYIIVYVYVCAWAGGWVLVCVDECVRA